jgi:hypothetical protein
MPSKPLIVILIIALASLWFVNAYSQGACTPNGCYGSNEILFGDFENFSSAHPFSNVSSDYAYNGPCVTGANGCGNYLCQFTFAVNNQLFPCNITWLPNIHDHTTGNGNMMVVDFPNNGPEQKIWCTQINLQPNKSYCIGAWFINLLIIGSNQGQQALVTVTSAPTPLISVNASPSVICSGSSTGLAANGTTSYQWAPAGSLSASTGDVVTASPTITTTYTVTGFNSSGCTASSSLSVNVVPQPQINLSVYDTSICLYQSVTVSASGANSFAWTPDFNQMPVPFQ